MHGSYVPRQDRGDLSMDQAPKQTEPQADHARGDAALQNARPASQSDAPYLHRTRESSGRPAAYSREPQKLTRQQQMQQTRIMPALHLPEASDAPPAEPPAEEAPQNTPQKGAAIVPRGAHTQIASTDAPRRGDGKMRGDRRSNRRSEKKKGGRGSHGSKTVVIFFLCLCVFSLGMLAYLLIPRFLAHREYISLKPQSLAGHSSELDDLASSIGGEGDDQNDAQTLTQELLDYYKQTNADFIGWLDVPDTEIHYPVVRGTDNDYYLTHTFKKIYSAYGSIFADYRCAMDLSDANTVIYGHNMKNGTMFHDLVRMLDTSYLSTHDTFTITSADGIVYSYRIFSVYEVSVTTDYRTISLPEGAARSQYFSTLAGYSTARAQSVSFSNDSKIVTFSTCPNDSDPNYRIAVHAVLTGSAPLE